MYGSLIHKYSMRIFVVDVVVVVVVVVVFSCYSHQSISDYSWEVYIVHYGLFAG